MLGQVVNIVVEESRYAHETRIVDCVHSGIRPRPRPSPSLSPSPRVSLLYAALVRRSASSYNYRYVG